MKRIGIYVQEPIAEFECAEALKTVLGKKYNTFFIEHEDLTTKNLKNIDLLVFGGGLGDSDLFDEMLADKKNIVKQYVRKGGRYLGSCMGAYFAGRCYFNLLKNANVVRYLNRENTDVVKEEETVCKVKWGSKKYSMYFFDGCAIIGNNLKTFATYKNGDNMAIIQDRIGLIGCHPESMKYWYAEKEMKPFWHKGEHHKLLLKFVDKLLSN
jgi:hypothetical protein